MYAINTQTGVDEATRDRIALVFDQILADEFALSTATRDYHWAITGPHFRSLYELFDEQYRELDEWMEKIVDRARTIGVSVHTGWRELTASSHFTPVGGAALDPRSMISALIALHVTMVEQLRENLENSGPRISHSVFSDLLNELMEYHETTAWLLTELFEDRELAQT